MINWFPGHMTKSLRQMEASLSLADVIIYVLDSRAVYSCMNPVFDKMIASKPIVYVLNKADLVPTTRVSAWQSILTSDRSTVSVVDATTSGSTKNIIASVRKLASSKLEKYQSKGIKTSLRGMVIGVPNCGKSTLINNFCGKAKAVTGNKPGVTRGKQWVRVNEYLELLDTPGTLYPKLSNEIVARHLAYIGSIKAEVTDSFGLSCAFLEELNTIAPDVLMSRYKTEFDTDADTTLQKIAKNRGYIIKGGEYDIERASNALLDDFRKGRLGKIMLDDVSDIEKLKQIDESLKEQDKQK